MYKISINSPDFHGQLVTLYNFHTYETFNVNEKVYRGPFMPVAAKTAELFVYRVCI